MRRRIWLALLACLTAGSSLADTGTLSPWPKPQFFTAAGAVCASCRLFTYTAGTSTKLATHSDVSLSSQNTNPIVLDSAGRTAAIFLAQGLSYKFVLAAAGSDDPPASPLWTQDNITSVPDSPVNVDISGTAGEGSIEPGIFVYLSDGTGGRTAGRWYMTDADNTYSSVTAVALGAATSTADNAGDSLTIRIAGRVTQGYAGLTTGSIYYISATAGSRTATPPTLARAMGIADSTTSLVITSFLPEPDAAATHGGRITASTQTIEGVKTFQDAPLFWAGGVTSNTTRLSGRIGGFTTFADVGNVGAGEDNLHSFSLPASTLMEDGQVLRLTAWGTYFDDAGNKQVKCYFGATQLIASGTLGDGADWHMTATIIRTAAATQRATAHFRLTDAAGNEVHVIDNTAPTETLSGAITVKCTGEATNNNDVIQSAFVPEVVG